MRSRMIAIAAGFFVAAWQPQLIPIAYCICIALLTTLIACFIKTRMKVVFLCFIFSFLYSSIWSGWQLDHKLPDEFARSDWIVEGQVLGIPKQEGEVAKFRFRVDTMLPGSNESIESSKPINLRHIQLAWYKANVDIKPEQRLHAHVRLKPPHGMVNPHGFDYERWLFVRGIDATGYIKEVISAEQQRSYLSVSSLREQLNHQISARHNDRSTIGLLQALITGDKTGLSQDDWALLRHSGTVHLAVISGLHVSFIAFVGWWVGRLFGLMILHKTYLMPYLFSIALAGGYTLLAGAEIPTLRAFVMVLVLLLSGVQRWYIDHWTRWWLALVAVLLISPLAVSEVGFWLSFGAVALLIWLGQQQWRWHMALKLQLFILVGMLPLYLYFFGGFSLVAPFINIVAIPLVSLLVIVAFLNISFAAIYRPLLTDVEHWLADLFWSMVRLSADYEWSYIHVDGVSVLGLFFFAIAVTLMLLPIGLFPRVLIVFLSMPLLFGTHRFFESERYFTAIVFDVGQGQSVLIEVGEYRVLYDTGPSYRSGGDAFSRAVMPYLKHHSISKIDHLILSHDDNDHMGGWKSFGQHFKADQVYSSFLKEDVSSHRCRQGESWEVDGVRFEFLWGGVGQNDNDRSCVLMVSDSQCSLLIPGDISKRIELRIIPYFEREIDWLVAAHHGSKSSTSRAFLRRIHPKTVLFSAGFANAFNHPHPDVIKTVSEYDADMFNTANQGAIRLNSYVEGGCQTGAMRTEEKRFWRSFNSL